MKYQRLSLAAIIVFGVTTFAGVCAGAEDSLKVVSYNIRYANRNDGDDVWPNRVDAVAETIAEHDIAGLQEVTHSQLRDLQQRLKDFDTYSIGRDDGKNAGEHTTILFRRDRFEATDQGTFWLSETPEQAGSKSWDAAITRICSWVVFRDKATDRRFWFANTHFDHRGSIARLESGKLIRRKISEASQSLPVILTGDFNCRPGSPPYNSIVADSEKSLVDVRNVSQAPPAGPNSTWCGFKQIEPNQIIDHVFVAGKIDVVSMTVLDPRTRSGRFASDHLPVQAVLRFR